MKIALILSQYGVVDREFGLRGLKWYNDIYYGNGLPGIFGNWANNAAWWQRLMNVRIRLEVEP